MIFEHSVGSCNSSSISHNFGLSVCLPATSFIEELCCLQCIYVVSINVAQIIRSFCSHIMQFQLQQQFYGSQYQSVCLSATSFMEVLCCYQCIIVVTVIVVCNIKNILLSYFQMQQWLLSRHVSLSVGRSGCLSACQQRVLQKCYAVGSVCMLLVLLQLRLLDHSVISVVSCDSSSVTRNVGLSVCLLATSFIEVFCCCRCMNVVTVVVVYDIRTFCCHILHLKLRQQL